MRICQNTLSAGIVYAKLCHQREEFMLYTNERTFGVQRTCIKTTELATCQLSVKIKKLGDLPSHSLLSKLMESSRRYSRELKLQTLVCGHQVFIVPCRTKESRVHLSGSQICGFRRWGYQPWSVDELRHDAATNRALSRVSTAHLALYVIAWETVSSASEGLRELSLELSS